MNVALSSREMEDAVLATDWLALEDGADPEKQNEERNEYAGKMRKVGRS